MHISFVILHYMTIEDTIECIESIKKNVDYNNYSIVVVDNGSQNDTGKQLKSKYDDFRNINTILSNENLGFAKGNNLGYKYAKYENNADLIVMINNDTIINQTSFCRKLVKFYNKDKFHIAGPNIISLVDNKKQNPTKKIFNTKNDVIRMKNKFKLLLNLNHIKCDSLFELVLAHINKIRKRENISQCINEDNFQLHGSCLIFSPLYIEKYDGLYDKTFMYIEECILKYIADRDNLIMKYYDDLTIYHKEDSSTNAYMGKGYKKRKFYYKNSIESCNVLINLMREEN